MIFVNLLALPNLGHENDSAHSKTSARDVALQRLIAKEFWQLGLLC